MKKKEERQRTWEYDTYRYATIHLNTHVVSWEDQRRGCEGGEDQRIADFIERGPGFGAELSRTTTMEMLKYIGVEKTAWFDPAITIEIPVRGIPVKFYADPTLKVHGDVVKSIVDKYGLPPDAYYQKYPPASGTLAMETQLQGFCFAADSEINFHSSGRVWIGRLSRDGYVSGRKVPAGTRIGLKDDGTLDFAQE